MPYMFCSWWPALRNAQHGGLKERLYILAQCLLCNVFLWAFPWWESYAALLIMYLMLLPMYLLGAFRD